MDSGSPHSSSGGDDDYDSRAAADHPGFMNPLPSSFDPFSSYAPQHQQQMSAWPGPASLRSDPNPQLHNLVNPFAASFQPPQQPPMTQDGPDTKGGSAAGASSAARNPRKRSRASRRAPTTVLTTDTTNFRAMVQEFTGIPAPPFSNPPFPRPNRLDNLFGPSRSAVAAAMEQAPPPFARRPFPQTAPFLGSTYHQQPPFPSQNQTSNNNFLFNNNINNNNNNQNPFFSSLLQPNPSKFTFSGSPITASKSRAGPGPDEFGLGGLGTDHHHLTPNELLNLIPSDHGPTRDDREDDRDHSAKWRRTTNADENEVDNGNAGRDGGDQLKPVYDFSGPSCEGEKCSGSENGGTTRVGDQGMVESWINNSSE